MGPCAVQSATVCAVNERPMRVFIHERRELVYKQPSRATAHRPHPHTHPRFPTNSPAMSTTSPRAEEDAKETVKPIFITLKVMDQEDRRIRHTIRMADKLQVVMDMYYAKAPEVTYGTGTFLFDGIRLKGDMTPMGLEMVDGDTVDFFPVMIGGGGFFQCNLLPSSH